jgi:hypothetical protein
VRIHICPLLPRFEAYYSPLRTADRLMPGHGPVVSSIFALTTRKPFVLSAAANSAAVMCGCATASVFHLFSSRVLTVHGLHGLALNGTGAILANEKGPPPVSTFFSLWPCITTSISDEADRNDTPPQYRKNGRNPQSVRT